VYYTPGSAKALNCIRGYQLLLEFAQEYHVNHRICGKIIAAVEEHEIPGLHDIYNKGVQNGLQGIELLDAEAGKSAEPHVDAIESLWVPQAGIIDFAKVCLKLTTLLQERGVSLYYDHEIKDISQELNHSVITTRYGDFESQLFINCCGLYADRVALLTGMEGKFRIFPFRGEFYQLSGKTAGMVNHLIYPVPDERFPFLGVHFTLRMDGTVEAGPNAVLAFAREGYKFSDVNIADVTEIMSYTGFYRMAFRYWDKGWGEMRRSVFRQAFLRSMQRLIPAAQIEDMKYSRSGVRAQCVSPDGKMIYDYLILENAYVINVVNAPSPAATSAFSIGEFLASKAINKLG
jgi:L-2-hydroxyglutarate oxidase